MERKFGWGAAGALALCLVCLLAACAGEVHGIAVRLTTPNGSISCANLTLNAEVAVLGGDGMTIRANNGMIREVRITVFRDGPPPNGKRDPGESATILTTGVLDPPSATATIGSAAIAVGGAAGGVNVLTVETSLVGGGQGPGYHHIW